MNDIDYAKELNELKKEFGDLKKSINQPTPHQLANRRYEKKQNKFVLRIPEHEVELWEHLKNQPNMNQYIKSLIAKDIGYKTGDHFKGLAPTEEYRKDGDADKESKKFTSKLKKIQSGDELNAFVENNDFSKSEGEQIESVLNFDEDPSGLAHDLFALGALPMSAGNKKSISYKVNDIIENAPFDAQIEGDKYSEKELKNKLLKRINIGDPESKLNTHLKLYAIDDDAIIELFKIDYKGE